jgi:hypothetical protein
VAIADQLRANGYAVLPGLVPTILCERALTAIRDRTW